MTELTNSKRMSATATYVAVELSEEERKKVDQTACRGIEKLNSLREVGFRLADVRHAREVILKGADFGDLGPEAYRFALAGLESLVQRITEARRPDHTMDLVQAAAAIPFSVIAKVTELILINPELLPGGKGGLQQKLELLKQRMKISPIGRLHLERMEVYPVGLERGELVFTVPLAPAETVTISHKEWSTTSQEFEQIIQDEFETYSERGVAEKNDASMSIESESRRASSLNFASSISGGFGPVSASMSLGVMSSAEDRKALRQTTQRLFEITQKASSRARQEHKISAKLETKKGVEDSSFRTISNPFMDKALRIDYYRMMRKWRTDVFRYGLRLTYDIVVPNPGARIWSLHERLQAIEAELSEPFQFPLKPEALTDASWQNLQSDWGVPIAAPPPYLIPITVARTLVSTLDKGDNFNFVFDAPEGYSLQDTVIGDGMWHGPYQVPPVTFPPGIAAPSTPSPPPSAGGGTMHISGPIWGSARQRMMPVIFKAVTVLMNLTVQAVRDKPIFVDWQNRSWAGIRDKAYADHQARMAKLRAERDALYAALTAKDTLTLRRLEREELIRQCLYWILGADLFDPAPDEVSDIIKRLLSFETLNAEDGSSLDQYLALSPKDWSLASGFGDLVRFFHQAIEWENLLYFLYPYFWGSDDLGRKKMLFEHPDPQHRDFLRAGYVRLVIPIRPGFETAFTGLVETGSYAGVSNAPYMSIASETEAFAKTNYPGIPPAHPEKHARPLLYPEQRATWATMQTVIQLLDAYAAAHSGAYPKSLADLTGSPFLDAWGRPLLYSCPGSGNDYDLVSLGADGLEKGDDLNADISAAAPASLVASWFDYTPSSGMDIAIDTQPDTIA